MDLDSKTRATVYSIYMDNIPASVVDAQRSVVDRFLPRGWEFLQYKAYKADSYSHPAAMAVCAAKNKLPITIFLDIDCVPLSEVALDLLAARAELGMLVGAVQRANHIHNDCHLYVGPFCMAFATHQYQKHGKPTFYETDRGDVGEELTYAWKAKDKPVYFLWPSHVEQPQWDLVNGLRFGIGTTYQDMFYHKFCARQGTGDFERRCKEILSKPKAKGATQ